MGKIQDAIGKVQTDRQGETPSAGRRQKALEIDRDAMAAKAAAMEAAAIAADTVHWNYQGNAIHVEPQSLIDSGLLDPDYLRKHLASEYRQLKKSIIDSLNDGEPKQCRNLIFVSSAQPNEGKSFIGMNLAVSLASEAEYSVVLVDADFDNARISKSFGVNGQGGLAELLADRALDSQQFISTTDFPGLALLPVGIDRQQGGKLIASDDAKVAFSELSSADPRRLFVIDTAGAFSGGAVVGGIGQILLVVKAGSTPRQAVVETAEKLAADRPVSIVLNQVVN